VRRRIGDKRIVGLVKAFLRAGVLSEDGITRDTPNDGEGWFRETGWVA